MTVQIDTAGFEVVDVETGRELKLAMQWLYLRGRILPFGAKLLVQHWFKSEEKKAMEVVYTFLLPRDAALRRFKILGENFKVRSELKPVKEALEQYEKGIDQGHLSGLARQYRDGMISLNLGNIRPGEEVLVDLEILAGVELHDQGFRFRFPFTLAPTYHAKAKTGVLEPGTGEMELPADEFEDLILPRFVADPSNLHQVGFDLSVWAGQAVREIGSPSHSLRVGQEEELWRISLGRESDVPDRDLVLDVTTKEPLSQSIVGKGEGEKIQLASIIPSSVFGTAVTQPRHIVFLLDRSGSMEGQPIQQARDAIKACLGALNEADQFSLAAFDDQVEWFKKGLVAGSRRNREEAARYLDKIQARGGTELAEGVKQAAGLFLEKVGDLLILTDGQVAGTEEILAKVKQTGIRLHCLGIGSASQDRFLTLLARESGGISRFLTPRERVDLAAIDLFAAIGYPLAKNLQVTVVGNAAALQPPPPVAVFSGTPILLFGEAMGAGLPELQLTWENEMGLQHVTVPSRPTDAGTAKILRLLQGARLITDLESKGEAAPQPAGLQKRQEDRISRRLEELSSEYGLASRQMALVAVVERAGDQAGILPETRVVPVGMPQDTSFGAYFGPPGAMVAQRLTFYSRKSALPSALMDVSQALGHAAGRVINRMRRAAPAQYDDDAAMMKTMSGSELPDDLLVSLAQRLESDGGMPGKDWEARLALSLIVLEGFLAAGNTTHVGPFRAHVQKLVDFLHAHLAELQEGKKRGWLEIALDKAEAGQYLPGDWMELLKITRSEISFEATIFWNRLESSLAKDY